MFGLFKKKPLEVVSPMDGELVALESINDDVFSKKLVGDGVAIIPSSGTIIAPINGVVTRIFPTKHAFMISGANGIEVMVHVGLDTVELNGEGFTCLVKEAGIPFRDAYHITGSVVNLAEDKGLDISELSLEDLQSVDERIGEGVVALLDNRASMNARQSEGGTSSVRTLEQIEKLTQWVELQR